MDPLQASLQEHPVPTIYEGIQPYQYKPLDTTDTIRVFCLEPSETNSDPLRGSITHIKRYEELAKLDDPQTYAAVSYTWGSTPFSQKLHLWDDETKDYTFSLKISEAVQIMLIHLRKTHKTRHLWVDAICLNQDDGEEKSDQIPLMGEIYDQAHKVHLWLGPESESEDIARLFATLRFMALHPQPDGALQMMNSETAVARLRTFFDRDWFSRRWILQEAAQARNGILHCGRHTILYPLLVRACRYLIQTDYGREFYGVQMTITLSEPNLNISTLLWKLHQSDCTDKKDRIAALYGLLPRERQLKLRYDSSYQEIYCQHAIDLIERPTQHTFLQHLFWFGAVRDTKNLQIPCWIPDWSHERQQRIPFFLSTVDDPGHQPSSHVPLILSTYNSWKKSQGTSHCLRDHELWQRFISKDVGSSRDVELLSRRNESPYTILEAARDRTGKFKLNLKWVNPWAAHYGRVVNNVVKITYTILDIASIPVIANAFAPLLENMNLGNAKILKRDNEPGSNNLGKLATLICDLMPLYLSDALDSWDDDHRVEVVALGLNALFTNNYETVPEHKKYIMMNGPSSTMISQTLIYIIKEIARMVSRANLCIAELAPYSAGNGELECDYIVASKKVLEGMLVIPLETRLPDGHSNAWTNLTKDDKARSSYAYRRVRRDCLTNMIVVKPIQEAPEQPLYGPRKEKRHVDEKPFYGRYPQRSFYETIPTLKAHYVEPCVGLIWRSAGSVSLGDQKDEESIKAFWDWVEESQTMATAKGHPPPFMIDVY